MDQTIDEQEVRRRNLDYVRELGTGVNPGLPMIGLTAARTREEIVDRALIVLALFNLSLDAPIEVIREWVESNGLIGKLTADEQTLLGKSDDEITQQELVDLSWSVETLYALMWVGGLVDDLRPENPLPSGLAVISPSIEAGDDRALFADKMILRPYSELYAMRDLFYVAHWSARADRLASTTDSPLSEEIVMERRKALEWALDATMDWDDVDQST